MARGWKVREGGGRDKIATINLQNTIVTKKEANTSFIRPGLHIDLRLYVWPVQKWFNKINKTGGPSQAGKALK